MLLQLLEGSRQDFISRSRRNDRQEEAEIVVELC
jgi:hypothetical protein